MNVSAPTVSQRAAVAALGEEAASELAQHVKRYEDNRAVVVSGLQRMGEQTHPRAPPRQQGASLSLLGASLPGVQTHEYAPPQGKPRPPSAARLARRGASPRAGAFYLYADLGRLGVADSLGMCDALLQDAGPWRRGVCQRGGP